MTRARNKQTKQVVLTGAKHEDHLNEALVKLLPILNQYKEPEH